MATGTTQASYPNDGGLGPLSTLPGVAENFIKQIQLTIPTEEQGISEDLVNTLTFSTEVCIQASARSMLKKTQVKQVTDKLAIFKGITPAAAILATTILIKAGAATAGASESLTVKVMQNVVEIEVTKNDQILALSSVTGVKKLRKLAETIALQIMLTSLTKLTRGSKEDLKGDLANKINRILASRGQR